MRPPPLAHWLLSQLVPRRIRDAVLGDLHEEYVRFAISERGSTRARLWYWTQVLVLLRDRVIAGFAVLALAAGVASGASVSVLVNGILLRSLPGDRPEVLAETAGYVIDGLTVARVPSAPTGATLATETALKKCPMLLSIYLPLSPEGRTPKRLPLPRDLHSLEALGEYLKDGTGVDYVRRSCLKLP